jgi:lipoate-protein ligase A
VKDGIIKSIKFFGDFLGHGDTSEIEKNLTGKKYNEEEITNVLKLYNLNLYFGEITVEEFVKYLVV